MMVQTRRRAIASLNISPIPLVSIIVVTYNSRKDIDECLKSIENQTYRNFEIIVVDNASSDGTADYIKRKNPFVRLVRSNKNLGYSGGNTLGLKYTRGEYIVVLNPDVAVDKDWLGELVEGATKCPKAGIIASNILLYDSPGIVNACGNEVHFTGLVFCRYYGNEERKHVDEEHILAPSGCSFLITKEVIRNVGFFDNDFFMVYADIDFAIRTQLRGYRCLFVPSSKVYHKFVLKMGTQRYFMLERGRYLSLLKNFSRRTLILLFPSLLLTEVLSWGYALYRGSEFIISKVMVYKWILKNLHNVLKKREKVQKLRSVGDKEILEFTTWKITIPRQWLKNRLFKMIVESSFNILYFMFYRLTLSIAG